ncbi:MAG: hypothetical protein HUU15_00105 [Candidatus Brocadiae bacterium]|nr:hypothetical protein [Candidatus Brocadiia bacterium]
MTLTCSHDFPESRSTAKTGARVFSAVCPHAANRDMYASPSNVSSSHRSATPV